MDEADLGNETAEKWFQQSIQAHQQNLKQCGDIEAELCNGCEYATKASWGKTCEAWRECLQDYDKAFQAKKRNGNE